MPAKKINKTKKYLIICSGGNAPGMANCVIAFSKKCAAEGIEPWAAANGLVGVHARRWWKLNPLTCQNEVNNGSALIGTSRSPEFLTSETYRQKVVKNIKHAGFDAVIVVGGEGSFKAGLTLSKYGINVITIPATIDNDVACTDFTIGFDTCLNKTCNAIADINDCFVSHHGVALIEIMGRTCPDLTIRTAIATNSNYMVTKFSKLKKEDFLKVVKDGFKHGKMNMNFIITEKLYGVDGYPSLDEIAKFLQKETGLMCRHVVVGYIQRGGSPSARDRLLANYMVNTAVDCLKKGKKSRAICYVKRRVFDIDLQKAINSERKSLNRGLVRDFNQINRF